MVRRSVHCLVQAMVHGQCTATHLHRSIKLKKDARHECYEHAIASTVALYYNVIPSAQQQESPSRGRTSLLVP